MSAILTMLTRAEFRGSHRLRDSAAAEGAATWIKQVGEIGCCQDAGAAAIRKALHPLKAPAWALNLGAPCTETSSGRCTSLSVVMMSPTRRPIRSAVVIVDSASVTTTST